MVRPRFILVLVAVSVVAAAVVQFAVGAVRSRAAAAVPAAAAAVPAVVTMKAALPAGHILRPGDLAQTQWGAAAPPDNAVLVGTPAATALVGGVTRRAFAAGELVVPGSVITPGDRGFLAAIVAPGHRAIAIAVDATTAAGGLIWPGDRVDVILTQEIRDDGVPLSQRVVSETILDDVRILSTDQKLENANEAEASVEGKVEPRRVPTTVTVEVLPEEAERVTVGLTLGKLNLTLRGVAGSEVTGFGFDPPATWAGSVSPALVSVRPRPREGLSAPPVRPVATAPAAPVQSAGVRIYRGSEGAQK